MCGIHANHYRRQQAVTETKLEEDSPVKVMVKVIYHEKGLCEEDLIVEIVCGGYLKSQSHRSDRY